MRARGAIPIRLVRLLRNLLFRRRVERDLDDEVLGTLALLIDEKMRAGMSEADATRLARLEPGSVESVKEAVRDARAGAQVETFVGDLRYGTRLLRRNPIFALTAVLSLAVGIGATTAIFTVANGLLLRAAVGVAEPDRLVDIVRTERGAGPGVSEISYPEYLEIRRRTTTLEDVFGYRYELDPVTMTVADQGASRVFANTVTANYFTVLRVSAAAGRLFDTGDGEAPGSSPVAVLSYQFWTRRFQSDPALIGQTIRLNDHPVTVVGIAREGFRGTGVLAADLWLPTAMIHVVRPEDGARLLTAHEAEWLMLGGRLRPGVSRAQASAEVEVIGRSLEREYPRASAPPAPPGVVIRERTAGTFDWSAEVASPIPYGLRTLAAGFLALLLALVSLVLAIACANLAGVLLGRATERRREIAVRVALGAGRRRVIRQLLTETMLLFALGGACGLLLARWITSLLVLLLPAFPLPVTVSVPLDLRVVGFSLGVSLVSALLSGLAPALQASRADVVSALKDESAMATDGRWLRNAFVAAQVALSFLLVATTGLLVQASERVSRVPRGFDSSNVEVASVDLSVAGYTEASGQAFLRTLIERVRALPGVETATLADRIPGPGARSLGSLTVPGVAPPDGQPSFLRTGCSWNQRILPRSASRLSRAATSPRAIGQAPSRWPLSTRRPRSCSGSERTPSASPSLRGLAARQERIGPGPSSCRWLRSSPT
ncbi:MAG: ABC transporter permease [Acidobacteria bacterium]|nr:ABC transporter permease [Acidobacteriota bacterium]